MRRYVDTRERVAELFEHGLNGRQIASRLGLSRSTVSYHLRNLGKASSGGRGDGRQPTPAGSATKR